MTSNSSLVLNVSHNCQDSVQGLSRHLRKELTDGCLSGTMEALVSPLPMLSGDYSAEIAPLLLSLARMQVQVQIETQKS